MSIRVALAAVLWLFVLDVASSHGQTAAEPDPVPAGDSGATRLIFGPTARALPRGEGYVGLDEFVVPLVQVGVTDRFSIGAGTPAVFDLESAPPIWVTPKYQFYRGPSTSVAAALLNVAVIGSRSQLGLAYVVETTGSADNAVSVGGAWAYARWDDEKYASTCRPSGRAPAGSRPSCTSSVASTTSVGFPVLMIGGERRLGRRVKLVTENYAFSQGGFASIAVRLQRDHFATDLGVFAPIGGGLVVIAPVVNFTWRFGS